MKKKHLSYCSRMLLCSQHFSLCISAEAFERELRRLGVPMKDWPDFISNGANATTHFLQRATGELVAIVCIKPEKTREREEVYGLLVHEAVHIWRGEMSDIGEKEPGEEIEAYGIQHIAQQLMCAYRDMT